jgi:autotransporter-associated beta strand protein
VTVPAGFAYRFNTDPGAGANGINVGATSAIIAGYALDQALVSRLAAASTGSVVLTADSANALNLTGANVGLGASGLVTYSGSLTPNAAGYRFSSIAGQGSNVGLNELKVASGLTGANALSVTGGTVFLTGENSFSGAVSLTGGTTRILNNSALGSGGVTLNGGTLQLLSTTGNAGALFGQFGNIVGDSRTLTIGPAGGAIDVPARIGGDSGFALTGGSGFSPLSGSGTLTKQGMGQLFLLNPSDFSGNLVIAANGDRVDVRSSGSLANVASITVNSRGILLVDNQNALGSRQFVSVNNNDRINNAAPITLNGGGVLYRARGAASQNTETFG